MGAIDVVGLDPGARARASRSRFGGPGAEAPDHRLGHRGAVGRRARGGGSGHHVDRRQQERLEFRGKGLGGGVDQRDDPPVAVGPHGGRQPQRGNPGPGDRDGCLRRLQPLVVLDRKIVRCGGEGLAGIFRVAFRIELHPIGARYPIGPDNRGPREPGQACRIDHRPGLGSDDQFVGNRPLAGIAQNLAGAGSSAGREDLEFPAAVPRRRQGVIQAAEDARQRLSCRQVAEAGLHLGLDAVLDPDPPSRLTAQPGQDPMDGPSRDGRLIPVGRGVPSETRTPGPRGLCGLGRGPAGIRHPDRWAGLLGRWRGGDGRGDG